MFLVNSSVGSFAAAPTSLNARGRDQQQEQINHDLSISVKSFVFKKDLITRIHVNEPERTHLYSLPDNITIDGKLYVF